MNPILLVEIISALAALCCLTTLLGNLLWMIGRANGTSGRRLKAHRTLGVVLLVCAAIHGIAATIYASGASPMAYAAGWGALALMAASGACAFGPIRKRICNPLRWHISLFLIGTAFFVIHAVAAHL